MMPKLPSAESIVGPECISWPFPTTFENYFKRVLPLGKLFAFSTHPRPSIAENM